MTYAPDLSVGQTQTLGGAGRRTNHPARRRRGLRGRIALVVFAVLAGLFLISVWSIFVPYDLAKPRVPTATDPMYLPVLIVHVTGGSVAMSTSVLQVWPWMRRHHPRVHRYAGRLYTVGGVYPAALCALTITAFWPFSPVTAFSDVMVSLLWMTFTTYGWMLARQRRLADHRRWMLRSFALTASIILNRTLGFPIGMILKPALDTKFAGSVDVFRQAWSASTVWVCWTIAFIAVEWYLDRDFRRRSAGPAAADPQSATAVR
jgi:uncharacterized membrane protein YozB (DUF420 family)